MRWQLTMEDGSSLSSEELGEPACETQAELELQVIKYSVQAMEDIIADLDYSPRNSDGGAATRETHAMVLEGDVTQLQAYAKVKDWYARHNIVLTTID
jgi:hypothetical protein